MVILRMVILIAKILGLFLIMISPSVTAMIMISTLPLHDYWKTLYAGILALIFVGAIQTVLFHLGLTWLTDMFKKGGKK